jgi:hypothetical protein
MTTQHFLDGFQPERDFAKECGVAQRTVARYRKEPNGLPWLNFGGKIFIEIEGGKQWLRRRLRQSNPTRQRASQAARGSTVTAT